MPAFVARYASAFADVVTDAKLDRPPSTANSPIFSPPGKAARIARVLRQSGHPGRAESRDSRQAERQAGLAKGTPQPARRAHFEQPHRPRGGSGSGYRRILQEQSGIRPAEIVTARELGGTNASALVAEWPS